jgi:hypothetical protein
VLWVVEPWLRILPILPLTCPAATRFTFCSSMIREYIKKSCVKGTREAFLSLFSFLCVCVLYQRIGTPCSIICSDNGSSHLDLGGKPPGNITKNGGFIPYKRTDAPASFTKVQRDNVTRCHLPTLKQVCDTTIHTAKPADASRHLKKAPGLEKPQIFRTRASSYR